MKNATARIRTKLLAGVVVVVPGVATFLALRVLFRSLDAVLGPWIGGLIGRQIPGLGVVATVIVLWIAGVIATHYLGARAISTMEALFARMPLIRRIYGASKEIVESAVLAKRGAFRDVVMVEFPRRGSYSYGFVTSYTVRRQGDAEMRLANVFIPGPPVPTTGVLVAVPVEELFYLDLPIEDALKLILSGGMAAPEELRELRRT